MLPKRMLLHHPGTDGLVQLYHINLLARHEVGEYQWMDFSIVRSIGADSIYWEKQIVLE
jgi:hypothetical protein